MGDCSNNDCSIRKSARIPAGKCSLSIIPQLNQKIIRYEKPTRTIRRPSEKNPTDELKFLPHEGQIRKK